MENEARKLYQSIGEVPGGLASGSALNRDSSGALDLALGYAKASWRIIPVPPRLKAPPPRGWPNLIITEKDIKVYFKPDTNIAVALGHGLVDVDLDGGPLTIKLADAFLPDTPATYGRKTSPRSHRLYNCADVPYFKAKAAEKDRPYLELRGQGRYALLPGSVHPTGESYEWEGCKPCTPGDGGANSHEGCNACIPEPAEVDSALLIDAVKKTALAALLIENYPQQGQRHDFALALSGVLLRAGWKVEDVEIFIQLLAEEAHDDDVTNRVNCVLDTQKKIEAGAKVSGLPTLQQMLGDDVSRKVREWSGVHSLQANRDTETLVCNLCTPPRIGDLSVRPENPMNSFWVSRKIKPNVFWVYMAMKAAAEAAATKKTPTFEGKHVFYLTASTMAKTGVISERMAYECIKWLKSWGLVKKVPSDWVWKQKEMLKAHGHTQLRYLPSYYILMPVPQEPEE